MFHVKGACRLLELRGPPSTESPLDMNLFRRIRAAAVRLSLLITMSKCEAYLLFFSFLQLWDSYASGKPTFLAKPEWRGLSDAPYDQLLDILVQLPSLLANADQIEYSSTDNNEKVAPTLKLLGKYRALRDQLANWYSGFQSTEPGSLFYLEKEQQHPYLDPDSDLNDLFPESVVFQTPYIAQLLMLYWYGEVLVHSVPAHVYRYLSKQAPNSPGSAQTAMEAVSRYLKDDETIDNSEATGDYFASKICQAMAGCGRNSLQGYGFQIALVPLWAAQEFYLTRSPRKYTWCRTVLTNFSTRGFVVAQNLGSLSLRQYPGRYLEARSQNYQAAL